MARKEEAIEILVAKMLEKERESLEEETRKVRTMASDLKGKDRSLEKERSRLTSLERDLQSL